MLTYIHHSIFLVYLLFIVMNFFIHINNYQHEFFYLYFELFLENNLQFFSKKNLQPWWQVCQIAIIPNRQIVHIYNILISEKIIFCRFLNASRGLFFPNLLTWRRIYVFSRKIWIFARPGISYISFDFFFFFF